LRQVQTRRNRPAPFGIEQIEVYDAMTGNGQGARLRAAVQKRSSSDTAGKAHGVGDEPATAHGAFTSDHNAQAHSLSFYSGMLGIMIPSAGAVKPTHGPL
jgi:hypothetical protein